MLDGRQPVAGEGGAPELARPAEGDHGRGPRRPGTRVAVAGGGVAGPRSSPASWGIMAGAPELACQLGDLGRRPAAAPVPERQVAGGGAVGCRSSPASWGDHGRRPAAAALAAVGTKIGICRNKMAAFGAARDGTEFKKDKQRARVYPFQADTGIGPYHRFP
jgi:hypothetical protein